jgi:hypothetical protein
MRCCEDEFGPCDADTVSLLQHDDNSQDLSPFYWLPASHPEFRCQPTRYKHFGFLYFLLHPFPTSLSLLLNNLSQKAHIQYAENRKKRAVLLIFNLKKGKIKI